MHPSLPYLLSSSDDMLIKLWDWDKVCAGCLARLACLHCLSPFESLVLASYGTPAVWSLPIAFFPSQFPCQGQALLLLLTWCGHASVLMCSSCHNVQPSFSCVVSGCARPSRFAPCLAVR